MNKLTEIQVYIAVPEYCNDCLYRRNNKCLIFHSTLDVKIKTIHPSLGIDLENIKPLNACIKMRNK